VPEVVGAGGGDVDGEGLLGLEEGVDECELDLSTEKVCWVLRRGSMNVNWILVGLLENL